MLLNGGEGKRGIRMRRWGRGGGIKFGVCACLSEFSVWIFLDFCLVSMDEREGKNMIPQMTLLW